MAGDLGRWLIALGLVIVLAGVVLVFAERVPWLGRLPGDIRIERGNWRFYAPVATSLLISIIVTVLLNVVLLFFRR